MKCCVLTSIRSRHQRNWHTSPWLCRWIILHNCDFRILRHFIYRLKLEQPHGWVGISMFRNDSPYLWCRLEIKCLNAFAYLPLILLERKMAYLSWAWLKSLLLAACLVCTKLIRLAPCLQFINKKKCCQCQGLLTPVSRTEAKLQTWLGYIAQTEQDEQHRVVTG